ncbi:L,D-transpeptidase family protein [Pueribacillus sp. YX66]|uniref:L,D-transpeptidase family protein n=1 Tax=Pueribacillus sp. YX66 TaxID=3229242 RepID=UPI00358CF368
MIYIDLWESTLFLIKDEKVVQQFKISGGTNDTPTPIGTFKVIEKSEGWGGGFGSRWLGLDVPWGKYGIHGTNKPWLIGQDVSSGCVRMFNDDVEKLYDQVPIGTIVHIDGPITGVGKYEFKNLAEGSKGTLVQIVQQQLKAKGYYKGKIDGIFNRETEKAVKQFQKDNNLPVTGGITKVEYNLLGILE